jgi:proteasome-associated ATPase
MTTEKEVIAQLKDTIAEYEAFIQKLQNSPHGYAVISHIEGDKVFLTSIGGSRTIAGKKAMVVSDFEVGDWFEVTGDSESPFAKLPPLTVGKSAEVVKLTDCAVSVKLGEQTVEVGFNPKHELRVGDTVRVDPGLSVVTAVIERAKQKATNALDKRVEWADVGGQVEAKIELIEAVEQPLKHPDIYARYNKRAPKGVLMFGPPGCGKTLLGKAVASSLVKDASAPGCFIYVKGPELLNPYVGVSESNVREVFARARAYKAEHNTPAVIFVDEADALLGARGKSFSTSRIEDTVVPQFLAEMDGLNESDVMVILATNRPDTLDPAVVRDGRVDRKVRVGRPTQKDAVDIFRLYLRRVPLSGSLDEVAEAVAHDLYTIERNLYELQLENGKTVTFGLPQLVSGALIEGVVEKATALAIRRELSGKDGPKGVSLGDLTAAVESVYRQNLDLNHRDAMDDFAVPHTIKSARKLAHAA